MTQINDKPNQPASASQGNGHATSPSNGDRAMAAPATGSPASPPTVTFEQAVILKRPAYWSRAIAWTLMAVTGTAIAWAFIAQIEEAVPAIGKLEPQGSVTEVQIPVGGVVKEVQVKNGDEVKPGQRLLLLDPTVSAAEQESLKRIRNTLIQENQYYRNIIAGGNTGSDPALLAVLPAQRLALAQNRAALASENRLYRLQLGLPEGTTGLTAEERLRFQANRSQIVSRVNAARLEVGQLERQLASAQAELSGARDLLKVDRDILERLAILQKEGAVAELQKLQQEQQVRSRQAAVEQLEQQINRFQLAIAQSSERVEAEISGSETDLFAKLADNDKRIAEIDSQISKLVVENERKIAELDSQLSRVQTTLTYQDVKAPIAGTIFDLKAQAPGFVANNTEPVLKIVPQDALIANVFITNKDIGFVHKGMSADVRIDSFPFSEFGDIKGKLVWIGDDALPPDEIHNYYRFPAKIQLDRQSISPDGRPLKLQSGMAVSVNIKLRKRSVASIFTDLFTKQIESLQHIR